MGISLDNWYSIPRQARENLIATRLARAWIDMIVAENSNA